MIERRGSVSPLLTLMMVPMIGALGMATESSGWFFMQRAAQNAADAAVLAAASNGSTTAPTYIQEAQGAAAKYGFANGTSNATVAATNAAPCPAPSTLTNCYRVTVTKAVPIALTTLVGYKGNTTVNGQPAVLVWATALASKPVPVAYCMVAMAHGISKTSDAAFDLRGAPKANFGNCSVFSNASVNCTGQSDNTIGTGTTVDSSPGKPCGTPNGGAAALTSGPYDGLKSSIPSPASCRTITSPGSGTTTQNWSGDSCVTISGDYTVPANATTTVTTKPGGTILLIQNGGNLSIGAGATLQQAFSSTTGLTVVFTGLKSGAPGFVTGAGGILDFGAPTSGTWSGMAMYQDSTSASNYIYKGNSPAFKITGIINAPYMNIQLDGAVNKQSNGYSCISFVVSTITSKGTGNIFATNPTSQCHEAGADPTLGVPNSVSVRQALVE